jgi:hypothetical protein
LYDVDLMSTTDKEVLSESVSREVGKLHNVSYPETSSPMHEMATDTCITPMDVEEKQNIINRLKRMFGHSKQNDFL